MKGNKSRQSVRDQLLEVFTEMKSSSSSASSAQALQILIPMLPIQILVDFIRQVLADIEPRLTDDACQAGLALIRSPSTRRRYLRISEIEGVLHDIGTVYQQNFANDMHSMHAVRALYYFMYALTRDRLGPYIAQAVPSAIYAQSLDNPSIDDCGYHNYLKLLKHLIARYYFSSSEDWLTVTALL